MKKIILMFLIMVIMIGGCGKDDKTPVTKEKKEEIAVEDDTAEDNTQNSEEGIVTEEDTTDVIESSTKTVPEENEKIIEKKTEKHQSGTKKETESQVTTPVVSVPTVTPEAEEEETCQHWYQPVETETCAYINKMTWACNGCGYALYDVSSVDYSPINFSNMYVHPPCETDRFEEPCCGGGFHSELYYYWEGCYECHTQIILRSCTTFHVMAERCVQNESNFGPYEKVETGHAFIKSCACGKNLMVSDGQSGEGLMVKKEVCSYCGDVKTYP